MPGSIAPALSTRMSLAADGAEHPRNTAAINFSSVGVLDMGAESLQPVPLEETSRGSKQVDYTAPLD